MYSIFSTFDSHILIYRIFHRDYNIFCAYCQDRFVRYASFREKLTLKKPDRPLYGSKLRYQQFTCSVPISKSLIWRLPSIKAEFVKGVGPMLKQWMPLIVRFLQLLIMAALGC